VRKGMNIAKVFSDPQTFLKAHEELGAEEGAAKKEQPAA